MKAGNTVKVAEVIVIELTSNQDMYKYHGRGEQLILRAPESHIYILHSLSDAIPFRVRLR